MLLLLLLFSVEPKEMNIQFNIENLIYTNKIQKHIKMLYEDLCQIAND